MAGKDRKRQIARERYEKRMAARAQARAKAASNDLDGAGELYVLYLNCTPAKESPERGEAARFLLANFNLRHAVELSAAVQ